MQQTDRRNDWNDSLLQVAFDVQATETTAVSGSQAAAAAAADLLGAFLAGTSETIMEKDGASHTALHILGTPSLPSGPICAIAQ